jgi:predicted lipoprotein with Yx(FWY)xxD motif
MSDHAHRRPSLPLAGLLALGAALLVLAIVLLAGAGAGPAHAAKVASVKIGTAQNKTLGKRILVTSKGRTLYTLSAEVHGKFICTPKSCLSVWKPLVLRKGQHATGVAHLGVVVRPDGRRQATYNGRPLYTFQQDTKKGDAKGEGFKDVGTWHAAVAPKSKKASSPAPQPTTPTTPSGGGYGY